MSYSEKDLDHMQREFLSISEKKQNLMEAYIRRVYRNPQAREFATHGFSRRLKTLARCIRNVFEILPPEGVDKPSDEELADANINLQAFTFNVFGSVDNLAWIWVAEKNVKQKDGSDVPVTWVGLGPGNKFVRNTLSKEFLDYLNGLEEWFGYQENFRHALAHKISLYIPPYTIADDKKAAWQDLEDALVRCAPEEYEGLLEQQKALGVYSPIMAHSFTEENVRLPLFHPQMLADFNTIEALGQKMLQELNR